MRVLYDAAFWLREALRALRRHRGMAGLSAGTMTAALLVLGSFALVRHNVGRVMGQWEEETDVSIFLEDGAGEEERRAIADVLGSSPAVETWRYLTKLEAIRVFEETFPALKGIVDPESHPVPASFEVRLKPEAHRGRALEDFGESLAGLPGIEDVRIDARLRGGLLAVVRTVRVATLGLGIVLLVASAAILFNGVRLQYISRRVEVEILRTIGATRLFLLGPYLTEGLLIGLVSGGIALAGVSLFGGWLGRLLQSVDPQVLQVSPAPLPGAQAAALVALGAAMGLLGSFLSLLRAAEES